MFPGGDEVEDSAHGRLGEQRLLVQVHDPVLVVQEVLVLLQTELERARLVQRARLALVRGVHHGLHHALVKLGQVDWVVRHNLHSEIS